MIAQSDIQGRLRLFRYGLIVVVVVTFFVALLAPFTITSPYAAELNSLAAAVESAGGGTVERMNVQITDFLPQALLYTVVVAVLAVVIYFVYSSVLNRSKS